MDIKSWSEEVAELAVDALIDAGFMSKEIFDRAVVTIAEEIFGGWFSVTIRPAKSLSRRCPPPNNLLNPTHNEQVFYLSA